MGIVRPACLLAAIALVLLSVSGEAGQSSQLSNSLIHPFFSRAEVEEFLRTAKIIKDKGTPEGITFP